MILQVNDLSHNLPFIGALWPIMSFYAELESGDSAVAGELLDTVKWPLGWNLTFVKVCRVPATITPSGLLETAYFHGGPTTIGMIEIPALIWKDH